MKNVSRVMLVVSVFAVTCGLVFAQAPVLQPAPPNFTVEMPKAPAQGGLPTGFLPNPYDPINLNPQSSASQAPLGTPASWDWRSNSGVTAVKDQGSNGTCWIFGGLGDFESKVKLNESPSPDPDYSEWDLWSGDPAGVNNLGGHSRMVVNHLTRYATIKDADSTYSGSTQPGPPYPVANYWSPPAGTPQKTATAWYWLGDLDSSVQTLKDYLYNQGPVAVSVSVTSVNTWCSSNGLPQFNSMSWDSSVVVPGQDASTGNDHAVLVVGWDDSKAWHSSYPGTGAWLVKNSWGTSWGNPGENGYFWIGYGGHGIGKSASVYKKTGYKSANSDETLLHYDEMGCWNALGYGGDYDAYQIVCYTPSFTGTEYLNYVDFWAWLDNLDYEIKVFDTWDRSGVPSSQMGNTLSGSLNEAGYYSRAFSTPVQLTNEDEFYIQLRITNRDSDSQYFMAFEDPPYWFVNSKTTQSNKCYISQTGTGGWSETSSYGDLGVRGRHSPAESPPESTQAKKWELYK